MTRTEGINRSQEVGQKEMSLFGNKVHKLVEMYDETKTDERPFYAAFFTKGNNKISAYDNRGPLGQLVIVEVQRPHGTLSNGNSRFIIERYELDKNKKTMTYGESIQEIDNKGFIVGSTSLTRTSEAEAELEDEGKFMKAELSLQTEDKPSADEREELDDRVALYVTKLLERPPVTHEKFEEVMALLNSVHKV